MKNKKLLYILIIFSVTLGSGKNVLYRPPLDTITDKDMSFSKTEVELYANQYYPNFADFLSVFYGDNSSDNMVSGNYNYNALISGTVTLPSSGGGWDWTNSRRGKDGRANDQVTKEPLADVNTYIGEMYFWRAWF